MQAFKRVLRQRFGFRRQSLSHSFGILLQFFGVFAFNLRRTFVAERRLHQKQVCAVKRQGIVEHLGLLRCPTARFRSSVSTFVLGDGFGNDASIHRNSFLDILEQSCLIHHDVSRFVQAELWTKNSGHSCHRSVGPFHWRWVHHHLHVHALIIIKDFVRWSCLFDFCKLAQEVIDHTVGLAYSRWSVWHQRSHHCIVTLGNALLITSWFRLWLRPYCGVRTQ
mmetsp:Transcript_1059/g.2988  ORF Transcript_1059/g.2988 Transcript_1059/m.2988 type:complete len:222 (-) Transcript_1059:1944-2609(-)